MRKIYEMSLRLICDTQMVLSISALIAMVGLNAVEIFRRYFFGLSIIWVQEVTVLLLLWFTFMGFSKITYDKQDIYIDFLSSHFPRSVLKTINILVILVLLAFLGMYTYYTAVLFVTQFGQTTIVARHPMCWRTLAPLVNGITMVLIYIKNLYEQFFTGPSEEVAA